MFVLSNLLRTPAYKTVITLSLTLLCNISTAETITTKDGVYTADQANKGKKVFDEFCSACHVKEFYQQQLQIWAQQPLIDLYDTFSATMPEDNAGGLQLQEYTDVLAYIFQLLELPAGNTPLNHQDGSMANIIIDIPK